MSRQHQELQRQAAAHSQRLEAEVKSLREQLGTAPDTPPLAAGMGTGSFQGSKAHFGGRNRRWEPFALRCGHSKS